MILVGDLHFGVKKFNNEFFKEQLKYISCIFDKARERNDIIFQFGDIFDNRNIIDILMFNEILEFFKKQCVNVPFFTILGNHDLYFNNGSDVSLVKTLAQFVDNFYLIDKTRLIELQGKKILAVPYQENSKIPDLKIKSVDYIFGHFDIKGFRLIGTTLSHQGLDIEDFKHYQAKKVFSGHYHLKQEQNGIMYIGTPYQLNWGDVKNENGIHYLEQNGEIVFEKNNLTKQHIKIKISDKIEVETNHIEEYSIDEIDRVAKQYQNHNIRIEYGEYSETIQKFKELLPEATFQQITQIETNLENVDDCKIDSPIDVLLNGLSDDETIQTIKDISNEAMLDVEF